MGRGKTHGDIYNGLIGVGCAILICLAGAAILAQMVLTGKAGEKGVNIAVPILLALSSVLGGQAAYASSKTSALTNLISAGMFLVVIVIAGLIIDGAFVHVVSNIGAVAVGAMISCALCLKKTPKSLRKKKRYR